jgi:hypothetical protein
VCLGSFTDSPNCNTYNNLLRNKLDLLGKSSNLSKANNLNNSNFAKIESDNSISSSTSILLRFLAMKNCIVIWSLSSKSLGFK